MVLADFLVRGLFHEADKGPAKALGQRSGGVKWLCVPGPAFVVSWLGLLCILLRAYRTEPRKELQIGVQVAIAPNMSLSSGKPLVID